MIPTESISRQAEKLFQLGEEQKLKFVNIADGSPQRGYSAVGTEKTASLYGKKLGREVDEKLTDARVSPLKQIILVYESQ